MSVFETVVGLSTPTNASGMNHLNGMAVSASFGAEQLRPHVKTLSETCDTLIMVYPNAGLPNELGAYDEAPSTTAGLVGEWASAGQVNVLGGCCGSTPATDQGAAAAPVSSSRWAGLIPDRRRQAR